MDEISKIKYIVGIDEVGRGPLAGPMYVGAFKAPVGWSVKDILPIRDSKKLSEKQRENIFEELMKLKKTGEIDFKAVSVTAQKIDEFGISKCLRVLIEKVLSGFSLDPKNVGIFLDGSLSAPDIYINQETIIKGDDKVEVISCASIVAKVSRDRFMKDISLKYPNYHFDAHKGYGTKMHYEALKKHGISDIHRKSFLSSLQ